MIEGGDFTFQCPPNHKELEQTVITKEIRIKELEMNLVEALSENSRNHERQMIVINLFVSLHLYPFHFKVITISHYREYSNF